MLPVYVHFMLAATTQLICMRIQHCKNSDCAVSPTHHMRRAVAYTVHVECGRCCGLFSECNSFMWLAKQLSIGGGQPSMQHALLAQSL